MKAKKANETALKNKATFMKHVYSSIEKEAKMGRKSLIISEELVDNDVTKDLKENGYSIVKRSGGVFKIEW